METQTKSLKTLQQAQVWRDDHDHLAVSTEHSALAAILQTYQRTQQNVTEIQNVSLEN